MDPPSVLYNNDVIIYYRDIQMPPPIHVGLIQENRVFSKMGREFKVIEWEVNECGDLYMSDDIGWIKYQIWRR